MPHREVIDGVLVIFGGAFLITPGFITDIFGVLLLLPPTRAVDQAARGGTARAPASVVGVTGARRRPRLRRGGHGQRVRHPARAARAVSAPALAVAFYDHARELYGTRALGRDRAVRGPQAHDPSRGPGGRGRRRRLDGEAAGTARPRVRAGGAGGRPRRRGGHRVHGPGRGGGHARGVPRHGGRDPRPARAGTSSTRCARSPRWPTRGTPLVALGRRPRGARGHDEEDVTRQAARRRAGCSRWRTRASPPSTTAAAASAAPGSSCGSRARSSPGAAPGVVLAGLVARPRRHPGARGDLPLAAGRPRRHRGVRADGAQRTSGRRVRGTFISRLRRGAHHRRCRRVPRLPGGVAASRSRSSAGRWRGPRRRTASIRCSRSSAARSASASSRDRLERELPDGFDLDAAARGLLRAPRTQRADDRVRAVAARARACAPRCSPTTCASGSRSGARSCPRSTRSSRWWWTRRSSGMRKPEPAIYELTLERLGVARPPTASSWTTSR